KKELAALKPVDLPVMKELPPDKRRETHLLIKGNFLNPGEKVEPGVPAAFHLFPPGAPRNRLGLAEWLVSTPNPPTARVAINRFWAQLFGTGIVETEEDFGTQGALPTHPELLDWLAATFVATEDGGRTTEDKRSPSSVLRPPSSVACSWSMKALLRL